MATRFSGLSAGGSRGGIPRVAGRRGLFHTGRSASQQSGILYARRQGWTDRETNQDPPITGAGSFHVRPPSGGSSVSCRNDDGADRCARYTPAVAAGVRDRLDDGRGRFDLRARLHASVAGSGAPATPAGRAATRSDCTTRPVGGGGFGATTISSPSGGVSPRTAAPERAGGSSAGPRRGQAIHDGFVAAESLLGRSEKVGSCTGSKSPAVGGMTSGS